MIIAARRVTEARDRTRRTGDCDHEADLREGIGFVLSGVRSRGLVRAGIPPRTS
jgi:hypothetical protein